VTVAPGPTADSLEVPFPPSPDDGGCPVTSYKVEWDPAGALGFQAGAKAKESLLFGAREAQVVTVGARKAGELSGTFRVGLLDEASDPIPAGCPASALAAILADSLPSMGGVKVTRSEVRAGPSEGGDPSFYGWAYTVTFVGLSGAKRWVGDSPALTISTSAADLPADFKNRAVGGTLKGSAAAVAVATAVDGARGFEQQLTLLAVSGASLRGSFRVGWRGTFSPPLAWNCTSGALEKALAACGAGPVRVARVLG